MSPEPLITVRIDVWLDVACLFRTRSEAQKACKAGKVQVNGQTSKPHREIKSGDEIEISRPLGRTQRWSSMRSPTNTSRGKMRVGYTKTSRRRRRLRKSNNDGSIALPAHSCDHRRPDRRTNASDGI